MRKACSCSSFTGFMDRSNSLRMSARKPSRPLWSELDRFNPSVESATEWLYEIAAGKLSYAQRRGQAGERARLRVATPLLQLSDRAIERIAALVQAHASGLVGESPLGRRGDVVARVVDVRSDRGIGGAP